MLFSLTLPRKIVVVMPAYNAAKTLKITYDDLPHGEIGEVILVDDASSDGTPDRIARRLRADGIARVGILPASRAEVDAPSFAVDLGAALAELTGGAVAVIDANLHWPTVPRPPSTPGGAA